MSCFDSDEMARYDINNKRVALHCCTREVIRVVCEFPCVVYKQEVVVLGTTIFRSRRSAERCFTHYCATADVKRRRLFCRHRTFYGEFGHPSLLPQRRHIGAGTSEGISCQAGMYHDFLGLIRLRKILKNKDCTVPGSVVSSLNVQKNAAKIMYTSILFDREHRPACRASEGARSLSLTRAPSIGTSPKFATAKRMARLD
jgi:hypothetical protein